MVPLDLLEFNTTVHCLGPVSPRFSHGSPQQLQQFQVGTRFQAWASAGGSEIRGEEQGDSGSSSSPQVVIESDLYAPRPVELLPHRTDRRDGEGRWSGRFQNPRLQGPHPAKTPARPGRCIPALRPLGPP